MTVAMAVSAAVVASLIAAVSFDVLDPAGRQALGLRARLR